MVLNWKSIITYIPFIVISILILIKILDYHTYHKLSDEDGIFEYLTAFVFLGSAYLSFKILRLPLYRNKKMQLVFGTLTLLFLIIALEEISWGQRIIGLETPDKLKSVNVQHELNMHNIGFFHSITMDIYILIGLVGVFGWWINSKINIVHPLLSPVRELRFYFLPILMSAFYFEYGKSILDNNFNTSTQNYLYFVERIDNEPCEMIMSVGFLLSMLCVYRRANKHDLLRQ